MSRSGHHLSGQRNFPRRIATAYYNSAVWRIHTHFADAIEQSLRFGLQASVHILKADVNAVYDDGCPQISGRIGGTGRQQASWAYSLCDIYEDAVILDIGTTTDIAIFAGGVPLIEPQGIAFNGYQTLVHALKTRSIGIGGDSRYTFPEHGVTVGPNRLGPAMAQGRQHPTLIDACNVKGIAAYGDIQASQTGLGATDGIRFSVS